MGPDNTTEKEKHGRPMFSGNEEDFSYWADRFEAFIHCKKLNKVLEGDGGRHHDSQNVTLWSELVQCLDKRSLMLVRRDCKNDGYGAWLKLKEHFKSSERPRILNLLKN